MRIENSPLPRSKASYRHVDDESPAVQAGSFKTPSNTETKLYENCICARLDQATRRVQLQTLSVSSHVLDF